MKLNEFLFRGLDIKPCLDPNCIIGVETQGLRSNSGCKCFHDLTRFQLTTVASRLKSIANIEINYKGE